MPRHASQAARAVVHEHVDRHAEAQARELVAGGVGAQAQRRQVGDGVERAAPVWTSLAGLGDDREHGPGDGVAHGRVGEAVGEAGELRVDSGHLVVEGGGLRLRDARLHGLDARLRAAAVAGLARGSSPTRARAWLELGRERGHLPLALVELARGGGGLAAEALACGRAPRSAVASWAATAVGAGLGLADAGERGGPCASAASRPARARPRAWAQQRPLLAEQLAALREERVALRGELRRVHEPDGLARLRGGRPRRP